MSARLGGGPEVSELAKRAFTRTACVNPAFALDAHLWGRRFAAFTLVEPPPLADETITGVEIRYDSAGLDGILHYSLTITRVNANPVVSGVIEKTDWIDEGDTKHSIGSTVDPGLVQALSQALTDLLPVDSQFSLEAFDVESDAYSPDWNVLLTFKNGVTLVMVTHISNVVLAGGPWQTEIDGQNYVQSSPEFYRALIELLDALHLAEDIPTVKYSGPWDLDIESPLDEAFPTR
jgi:hypothetical protein